MAAIIGRKLGMTQVFTEDGSSVPVTVIEAGPCKVTAVRRSERDGYDALQLAFEGVRMPGRMGGKRVTQRHLEVVEVDPERNLLLVKGAVPGSRNATVEVR